MAGGLPNQDSRSPTPDDRPVIPNYELLRCIGHGAYGEVWLARNLTGSYFAVKVVYRRAFDHDRPFEREFEGIRRFEPISRSHPSQLAIHHFGRSEDGSCFYYVMDLADAAEPRVERKSELRVEGERTRATGSQLSTQDSLNSYQPLTLKHLARAHDRLPVAECVRIGLALTTALEHLHQHGLVHRDVKPSNVVFVQGVPKLADIGLVASIDATRSYVGTEGFLPPEGPGTPQADLYALGRVLYEISTGKDRREFPELPTQLPADEQQALTELNAIIVRACQPDPAKRYQTAGAMRADLQLLERGKSPTRHRVWQHRGTVAAKVALAGVLVLALAWLFKFAWRGQTTQTALTSETASVFVLPFRNDGTNGIEDDLRGRITDAFIDSLALIDGVRRSPRKSGWVHQDEDALRQALAKTNDMRHVLTGRIASSNDTLTLTLRLYERRTDQPLWSETFSGKTNEVVTLERRALEGLAARLQLKTSTEEWRRIDQLLTNNLEALHWYRQAVAVYFHEAGTQNGYKKVRELARKAADLDPLYLDADAFDAYMIRNLAQDRSPVDTWPDLRLRMEAILSKDDTQFVALDQLAGCALFWGRDWALSDALANRALQALPHKERFWHRAYSYRTYGWFKEARADQEQSEHPEPTVSDQRFFMASARWVERRYAEGAQVARRTLELYPGHAEGYFWLAHCLVAHGQYEEELQAIEKAQEVWKKQEMTALKGFAYARMGQPEKAREVLKDLLELKRTGPYLQPYFVARVYAALGEKDNALDWLEMAEREKSEYLVAVDLGGGLRTDRAWDGLQGEPRYWQLCERVGLGKHQWPRPRPMP